MPPKKPQGSAPAAVASDPFQVGRVEVAALDVPDDPVNDAVAKIAEVGEGCPYFREERGVAGGRQWAGGLENSFDLIRRELL